MILYQMIPTLVWVKRRTQENAIHGNAHVAYQVGDAQKVDDLGKDTGYEDHNLVFPQVFPTYILSYKIKYRYFMTERVVQVVLKWYWDVWYFMKNIKNTYHFVIGVFLLWIKRDIMLTYWSGDLKTIGCCV